MTTEIIISLTIFNLIILVLLLRFIYPLIKIYPKIKFILTMWGKGTIQGKLDKIQTKEQMELVKSAKIKLGESIKTKVPLGLADKLNPEEIFALITDAEFLNFIKGIGVMGNIAVGIGQELISRLPGHGEAKEQQKGLQTPHMT